MKRTPRRGEDMKWASPHLLCLAPVHVNGPHDTQCYNRATQDPVDGFFTRCGVHSSATAKRKIDARSVLHEKKLADQRRRGAVHNRTAAMFNLIKRMARGDVPPEECQQAARDLLIKNQLPPRTKL